MWRPGPDEQANGDIVTGNPYAGLALGSLAAAGVATITDASPLTKTAIGVASGITTGILTMGVTAAQDSDGTK